MPQRACVEGSRHLRRARRPSAQLRHQAHPKLLNTASSSPLRAEERFSRLSITRRQLIELMSDIRHGAVSGFDIRNGEPVLEPPPTIVYDLRIKDLDDDTVKARSSDYALKYSTTRLFALFTRLGNARIERLEVSDGLPWRISCVRCPRKGGSP